MGQTTKIFRGCYSTCKTPNQPKFRRDRLRNVGDILSRKFLLPGRNFVGQSSPKSLKTCYPINPPTCQISSRSVKPAWRKALQNFLHPSIFWFPRGTPWTKGQLVWVVVCINPPLATWKISSFSHDPSPRYLLPKLVDFVAGLTNKHRPTYHTVNDMSPYYMRRQQVHLWRTDACHRMATPYLPYRLVKVYQISIGHADSYRAKFCNNSTRSVLRYPLLKICAPRKSGRKFTKIT